MKILFLRVYACICILFLTSPVYSQSYPGFPESFDGTTFAPTGWTVNTPYGLSDYGGPIDWTRVTSYGGIEPQEPTHTGAGMAWYNSWDLYYGESSLITPSVNFTAYTTGTNQVSFWMFRSDDPYWGGYEYDWVDIYVNNAASLAGATFLDEIYDGIYQSPSVSSEGWYQYSYTLPASFSSSSTVYIIFDANSSYAVDMYLDDVSVDHIPPPATPCSGVPNISISTVPGICTNIPFTLVSTTNPTPLSGITYQWQSSNSATGPWTSIVGATNSSYTTSISSLTYFRCQVFCVNSGFTGTSNVDTTNVTSVPSIPTVSSNSPVCAGVSYNTNNIILTASDLVAGVSYTWSGPNGFSVSNDPSSTQTISNPPPAAAGTYTVYASLNGCSSATNSTNVILNPTPARPVVSPSFTAYCQDQPGATALSATGANLLWHTASTGGAGSSVAPTPSVTNAGLFFWYVTQTIGGCESAAAIDSVLVKTKPSFPYTTAILNYCQGDNPPQLTAIGANLLWYLTATGGSGSSVPPTPSSAIAGSFSYYVTQTVNGCESDRFEIHVNIKAKPAKPGVTDKTYCQFDFALPLSASGSNLLWYTSGSSIGSSIAPTPNTDYEDTQYYYVTQTINYPEGIGCASDKAKVTVIVDYTPNALIVANQPYVCQYDSIFFSYYGNALPTASYNWTMPTGATMLRGNTGQGPIWVKFDSAGKRIVSLQVTNKKCKSPLTSYTLDVRQAPLAPTNIKPEVCQGQVLDVSLGYANEQIDKFDWNFDGADIVYGSEGGPFGIRYNTPGIHIINMVAWANSCPSIPVSDTVTVHPLADAHIGDVSNSAICAGDSVVFTAERYNPAYLYQWEPAIYFGTKTNQGQVYGYIEHSGFVKLNVTTEFGCTSRDSTLITAQPCCEVFFPNAFTPNGDGKNDLFRPISKGNQQIKTFRVVNRWGQVMFETTNPHMGWDGKFNGAEQDMGTYYYYIKYVCANGRVFDEKGEVLLVK